MPKTTMNIVTEEALDEVIDAGCYGYDAETGLSDEELDDMLDALLGILELVS